jgi:hypothetical protein
MRIKTILDQHDEAGLAEAARNVKNEAQRHRDRERALAAAHQQFDAAFREWRVGRCEYKALIAAIKREGTEAEISFAAASAGCTPNDFLPLIEQRRRALRSVGQAKELPSARRCYDELEKQYRSLDSRFPSAKTPFEAEQILEEIQPIAEARAAAARELAGVQVMHEMVEEARNAGLI